MENEQIDRLPPLKDPLFSTRRNAIIGLGVGLTLLVFVIVKSNWTAFQPAPIGPFPLGEIERVFDENPARGMRDYGGRPVLVDATVEYIEDQSEVKLTTVFLLDVDADVPNGAADLSKGDAVRLHCSSIEDMTVAVGHKPKLMGCSIISRSPAPAPSPSAEEAVENAQ